MCKDNNILRLLLDFFFHLGVTSIVDEKNIDNIWPHMIGSFQEVI
jgi:hypothetical protein